MKRDKVSAVFCATDTIAIGVASKLRHRGYSIPEDISLVGFDGLGHQLLANPTITTIKQPVYELGVMLANTLLDRLNGRKERVNRMVSPDLMVGQSDGNI